MDSEIIAEIKKKKDFHSLDDGFVREFLNPVLKTHKLTKKNRKLIVKEVRAKLREVYSVFRRASQQKILRFVQEIKSLDDLEMHKKILKLHQSTNERLERYQQLYTWIFKDKEINSLLDLGCGLNPLSYPFMNRKLKYMAVELTEADAELIRVYFKKCLIEGEAYAMDLTKDFKLPKVDMCFIFKLLDTLESVKRNITKQILDAVDARYIVVSFSTKSLGGGKYISKKRLVWFERLIKEYKYETFELPNEFFYLIQKH